MESRGQRQQWRSCCGAGLWNSDLCFGWAVHAHTVKDSRHVRGRRLSPPVRDLHCHTTYSLLDGANKVGELVKHVKSLGMSAIAVTDHGNLYGGAHSNFTRSAATDGIPSNPIGYEAYIAPGPARNKEGAAPHEEAGYHLTLLAKRTARVFFRTHQTRLDRVYRRVLLQTRIDKEVLREHRDGIICLSGCVPGRTLATLARRAVRRSRAVGRVVCRDFWQRLLP